MWGIFTWQQLNNSPIQWAEPLVLWVIVSTVANRQLVWCCRCRQGLVLSVRAQTWTSRRWVWEGAENAELSSDKCILWLFIKNLQWHFGSAAFLRGKGKQRKKKWKNTRETAGGIVQISLQLQIHSEMVTLQSRLTRSICHTYRNLPIYLCCFHVSRDSSSNWFPNRDATEPTKTCSSAQLLLN